MVRRWPKGVNRDFRVNGGATRDLIVAFPQIDAELAKPVLFAWHGLLDSAENFHRALGIGAGSADFPYILVIPESTGMNTFDSVHPGVG